MVSRLTFLALLLILACPAHADFQSGLDAYNRGDYAAALQEWKPLAEKGDANAQYNVGLLYARGQGVTQDFKEAAEWYRRAAEQGVPAAQYNLGVMYSNGEGVNQDPAEARKWFTKAAEKGVREAESGLEALPAEPGAFRDFGEAEKWYRQAAEKGVASAQFNLGVMYDLGQGVSRNYEEAAKWYRKAAEQGYAGAMCNLAILYYNAQGVKRDLAEAYAWFTRAQQAGEARAEKLARITASRMKPKDIDRAQQLMASWKPVKQEVATTTEPDRLFAPQLTADTAAAEAPAPASAATGEAARGAESGPVRPEPSAMMSAPAPMEAASRTPAPTGIPDLNSPAPPALQPAVQHTWTGVERIVAIGDVHGDFEQFLETLASANLIDGNGNWIGEKTHLVQTGDILDRGPDSRKVMDLLMRLEEQARAAGGAVHVLIGNHEAMNIYGDLRYVSPGEFAAFREDPSVQAQVFSYERARRLQNETAKPELDNARWEAADFPGFQEHRQAFSPEGTYGGWIRGLNAAVKINDTLFVHAGLSPKYASWGLDRLNHAVRAELANFGQLHGGVVIDEQGPLWYRGLAQGDEAELQPVVEAILQNYGVKRVVVGHSYAEAAITPRFGGKVILIDIGLSRVYDNVGKVGALVIENGRAYALHRGQGLELPRDSGPDMLRYLKQAAALDPRPSPLEPRIAKLEK
jgi:TPR repeat protein